jgi:hypothetical protein
MMTVRLMEGVVEVSSVSEASRLVTEEIDEKGVGASAWYGPGMGVVTRDGEMVARISYNGRVWLPDNLGGWVAASDAVGMATPRPSKRRPRPPR